MKTGECMVFWGYGMPRLTL